MKQHPNFSLHIIAVTCMTLVGCANQAPSAPAALDFQRSTNSRHLGNLGAAQISQPKETQFSKGPKPPAPIAGNLRPVTSKIKPSEAAGDLTINIEQMALPAFIQAIYGGILQLNYSVDPIVTARTDLITFHTPKPLSAERLNEIAGQLLKSYGVAVQDFGGVLRIVPDTSTASTLPMVRRGRAQSTVPLPLRPVFHYIETDAVRPQLFIETLKTILGNKVKLEADNNGGLLISGQPDDVQVALELVQVFDQPTLRGQNSTRVVPRFWSAEDFARRLADVLKAEGYSVGQVTGTEPILLLPLPAINSVLIFSSSKEVLAHVLDWVKELDQLTAVQAGSSFFTYPVRNADAQELAKSFNDLISGTNAATPATGTAPATTNTNPRSKRVVVNSATNSLIFQGGSQEDYRQWLTLLAELDRPVKSALIDVLVAEVALADNNDLGFSWKLDQLGAGATSVSYSGTTYGLQASGAGLGINALLGGNPLRQLAISALASNSDSRVISNPKVMTRNGESASISVGQDVPTVTSQGISTSNGLTSSTTNVIPQTIQYRNTGVLLKVRPVIHAGDRIDLEISQEVSSAEPTTTGVTTSPTIRKRSVETKLSLRDGATVMLAGLISETNTESDSGVPGLKDIPGLGNLFKSSGKARARTELVMLITPYIINDSSEAEAATDAYQATLGNWADSVRNRVQLSRTLRKNAMPPPSEDEPTPATPKSIDAAPGEKLPPPKASSEQNDPLPRMIQFGNIQTAPDSGGQKNVPAQSDTESINNLEATTPSKPLPKAPQGTTWPAGSKSVDDPALLEEIQRAIRNGK